MEKKAAVQATRPALGMDFWPASLLTETQLANLVLTAESCCKYLMLGVYFWHLLSYRSASFQHFFLCFIISFVAPVPISLSRSLLNCRLSVDP